MFASNKLRLLISATSFFPQLCTAIYMYCNHTSQRSSSCFIVANGGPAAAHVASVLWLLGARPQEGTRARDCAGIASEAGACGRDVTARRGRAEAIPAKYGRHAAKNYSQQDFLFEYDIGWCHVQFYCVKIDEDVHMPWWWNKTKKKKNSHDPREQICSRGGGIGGTLFAVEI